MQQSTSIFSVKGRFGLLALTTLAAAAWTGLPASAQAAQTPAASQAATANLVTKADLQATGAQLGQKITAQADELAALRQQLLALKAQLDALDRQVNGMKVPTAPTGSRILPGH